MNATSQGEARSLGTSAAIARGLLVGYMIAGAIMTVLNLLQFVAPIRSEAVFATLGFAALATMACVLASVVAVSVWIYLAHDNLRAMGLAELKYAPGWAVGSFFVPIVNLFVPFQAMRDLYNRSMGEEAHLAHESAPDVTSWWTCYIVGSAIQLFLAGMVLIDMLTNVYFTTPATANMILLLFASLLLLGSAFFLHRIIGAIVRAQRSGAVLHHAFA